MSEVVVVKRKDLEELVYMLEDALSMLEEPDYTSTKDELVSIIEYVYGRLRQILKSQRKEAK
jgi:uncharacterized membrane protein